MVCTHPGTACLKVGDVVVYFDRDGNFQARSKKVQPLHLSVLTKEFAAPGRWRALSASASIAPEQSVHVLQQLI